MKSTKRIPLKLNSKVLVVFENNKNNKNNLLPTDETSATTSIISSGCFLPEKSSGKKLEQSVLLHN